MRSIFPVSKSPRVLILIFRRRRQRRRFVRAVARKTGRVVFRLPRSILRKKIIVEPRLFPTSGVCVFLPQSLATSSSEFGGSGASSYSISSHSARGSSNESFPAGMDSRLSSDSNKLSPSSSTIASLSVSASV